MQEARAVYATTMASADAMYLTHTHVPDAFVLLEHDGEKLGILSVLEFHRMKTQSALNVVLPLEEYCEKARAKFGADDPGPGDLLAVLLAERGLNAVRVGPDFPAKALRQAESRGIRVDVADGALFPERKIKSDYEANEIRKGNAASCAAYFAIEKILADAHIEKDGALSLSGEPLTSEHVKAEINVACIRAGAWAMETIFAGGDQACDPHCEGTGVLYANQLIVADIFPRLDATGYYGDMTRTYLKGRPTPEQTRLVETVAEGQKIALSRIHANADGREIHMAVTDFFTSRGYPTEKRDGRTVGFFHGLGHAVGLDIHEAPRMNRSGSALGEGNVVTVEPGLYYPGLGGCRIEDVVRVTKTGCEMLSSHSYDWVIE
jgi:Xaa-Pro aminopeptidase